MMGCEGQGGHKTRPYEKPFTVGAIPCGRPRQEHDWAVAK
jgi:hypothetical protein